MPQIKISIFENEPEAVKYFASVDALKQDRCTQMPISELEEKFAKHRGIDKLEWTNNPYLPTDNITSTQVILDNPQSYALLSLLPENKIALDKLGICYLNDKIGYGVVTTDRIPKGSWMLFNGHTLECNDAILENNCYISFCSPHYSQQHYIDAKSSAGFSSMFLASTDKDVIHELESKYPEDIKKLGTENFTIERVSINGISQIACIANRDIEPHEVLFADYGKSFFLQFTGDFQALNRDGSLAATHIQNEINQLLHQYVAQRNSSNVSAIALKNLFDKMDLAQIDNKHCDYPRVFFNEHIFIVYSEAYNDLLKLIGIFLEESNNAGAAGTLSFLKQLNIQYNDNDSVIANEIKVLEHKTMIAKINEELAEASNTLVNYDRDLKNCFTHYFIELRGTAGAFSFWKQEHPINELHEKVINNNNTVDDYSKIIALASKERTSEYGDIFIELAKECMAIAEKIAKLSQAKLSAEEKHSKSSKI
jgi:hypothetical protein